MMYFIEFIVSICNKLISMMASDVFTAHLGAPFLYFILAFFGIWIVTNVFILRPLVGGSLVDGWVNAHNRQIQNEKAEALRQQAEARRQQAEEKRNAVKVKTSFRYDKDGNVIGGKQTIFDPTTNITLVKDIEVKD